MRSVSRLLAVVIGCCVAAGCASGSSGSGSGSPPADAGSGSGGTGGGSTDAGTGGSTDAGAGGGGGTADAGGGGGGTDGGTAGGGGGTDGGPIVSDCAGLVPASLPTTVVYQATYSTPSQPNFCGLPIGDGNGYVALETFYGSHPVYTLLTPSGLSNGSFSLWHGQAWPKPAGFIAYGGSSSLQLVGVNAFDDSGHEIGSPAVTGSAIFASDPNGGLFAVGKFHPGGAPGPLPAHPVVELFNADATVRYGPVNLGTDAPVFGAGVDLAGRAVVVVDGSALFGSGSVAAIWFDAHGAPMTGLFQVLADFHPGPSTWLETSPLIGSGLALRRMDVVPSGSFTEERRTSQWLALLPSGEAHAAASPDWLAQRPNTNLQFARSRLAYAFSPWAADVPACAQQVEVVSPSGNSCGTVSFPVDASACTTRELRIGLDGTVAQMLPASREQNQPAGSTVYTCTLRYWPGALH